MSVCFHDPTCPGHGPEHDAGLLAQLEHARQAYERLHPQPVSNPSKDRRLPGKARRRARKATR